MARRPRCEQLPLRTDAFVLCTSRCVRGLHLLGRDRRLRIDGSHRRDLIESLLVHLQSIFAIEIVEAAILENHLHLLLRLAWSTASEWSAREVAERWIRLKHARKSDAAREALIVELASDPTQVEACRLALCHPSEFHKMLKQTVAQHANREDGSSGSFWSGRFHMRRVLADDGDLALLLCAAYVALNEVRAGLADVPEASTHSTIRARFEAFRAFRAGTAPSPDPRTTKWFDEERAEPPGPATGLRLARLEPTAGSPGILPSIDTLRYLEAIDELGRIARPLKRRRIEPSAPSLVDRLGDDAAPALEVLRGDRPLRGSVIGTDAACRAEASRLGRRRVRSALPIPSGPTPGRAATTPTTPPATTETPVAA